ncbi:hypothetical protein ElyMa_000123100 [Elysia marginata]|uniref:Peptidase S1 domain-containing protein n=1 Tax=Elysia marginata TaxID=1093978 RepID=A0AAV4EM17_9GAST|nr:hypothetical protein ElyMa_000123100 [Elysia marginata]
MRGQVDMNDCRLVSYGVSDAGKFFQGDGGAPVFCLASANKEWILIGITVYDNQICGSSTEARVIPFPITPP